VIQWTPSKINNIACCFAHANIAALGMKSQIFAESPDSRNGNSANSGASKVKFHGAFLSRLSAVIARRGCNRVGRRHPDRGFLRNLKSCSMPGAGKRGIGHDAFLSLIVMVGAVMVVAITAHKISLGAVP